MAPTDRRGLFWASFLLFVEITVLLLITHRYQVQVYQVQVILLLLLLYFFYDHIASSSSSSKFNNIVIFIRCKHARVILFSTCPDKIVFTDENKFLARVKKLPFPLVLTYFDLKSWIRGISMTQCLTWFQISEHVIGNWRVTCTYGRVFLLAKKMLWPP